jgi:hypothetical protein
MECLELNFGAGRETMEAREERERLELGGGAATCRPENVWI